MTVPIKRLSTADADFTARIDALLAFEAAADAAKLADRVAALAGEAASDAPDGDFVRDLGETVKRAAGKVAGAVPGVMTLAAAIVELVAAIVGQN